MISLADLGVIRLRGPDTVRFLQGQLSNDVARLSAERSQLTGYHNPQGRTIAVLRLLQIGDGDLLAVLPRELAPTVAARLGKFILRSKVKITDESADWRVEGWVAGAGVEFASLVSAQRHAQVQIDGSSLVCVDQSPSRWLMVSAADQPARLPWGPGGINASGDTSGSSGAGRSDAFGEAGGSGADYVSGHRDDWRRFDIAAGLPQVYAATSEEFVAQMLNLDVLEAIAFDKGCYTGQEVIARAHYRGRVKRRMQRFVSREPCQLAVGESKQLQGRSIKIVETVQLADGRCEFLAVAPLGSEEREASESGSATPVVGESSPPPFDAQTLPLPYALPD
jgi:folate-binding protein YgfZ